MSYLELVSYIVKHFDSQFLVPLSEKYDTRTWNTIMHEAMKRLERDGRISTARCSTEAEHIAVSRPAPKNGPHLEQRGSF